MNHINKGGQEESSQNSFDIRLFFHNALKYWYLFVLSFVIAFFIGKAYVRYTQPIYAVNSTVMIKDGGYYSSKPSGQLMEGLGMFKMSYNIFNELEIMKSYALIYKAVKSLDFQVSYFVSGAIKTGEVYQSSPFTVELDSTFANQLKSVPIYIELLSDSTYHLKIMDLSSQKNFIFWKTSPEVLREYNGVFNRQLKTADFSITVKPSIFFEELKKEDGHYYFVINDLYAVASRYASKLGVAQQSKYSSLIMLTVSGEIIEKEINFLNALTDTYIKFGLTEKNEITTNTVKFIDDQLHRINDSLKNSSNQLEQFSNKENFVVEGSSDKVYDELDFLEKKKAEFQVQKKYYQYLLSYIEQNNDMKKVVSPSAVGISDMLLGQMVSELYTLQSEQTSLAFSAKEKNHSFGVIELKIKNTRANLIENLTNLIKTTDLYLKDNQERLDKVYALLYRLPKSQRYFANLQRQYSVNEKMYSFLLEKKTEAEIAKASNVSDNKVVNPATLSGKVFPNESTVQNNVMLLGLFFPLLIVGLLTYFNSIVVDKAVIARKTSLPILGVIGHFEGDSIVPALDYPKSSFADSVRALRINLQYLAADKKSKVVGVTSTVSGEGKTFFALNIALSLVQSGAKVVLLGVDLRRPRLTSLLGLPTEKGISSYLIGKYSLDEILHEKFLGQLDVISAGPVPPNPSELIESQKFADLIDALKLRYDYIIIDSSPVGLVSDYLLLAKLTDVNLYMVRQNYTRIAMLEDLESFKKENSLANMYLIYNDVKRNGGSWIKGNRYGYGYGYGYGNSEYGSEGDEKQGGLTAWRKKMFELIRKRSV